jgi:hypothetical protein
MRAPATGGGWTWVGLGMRWGSCHGEKVGAALGRESGWRVGRIWGSGRMRGSTLLLDPGPESSSCGKNNV